MKITFEIDDKTGGQFDQMLGILGKNGEEVLPELVKKFICPYLNADGELTPRRAKVDGKDAFVFKDTTMYGNPYYVTWTSGQYVTVPAEKVEFLEDERWVN